MAIDAIDATIASGFGGATAARRVASTAAAGGTDTAVTATRCFSASPGTPQLLRQLRFRISYEYQHYSFATGATTASTASTAWIVFSAGAVSTTVVQPCHRWLCSTVATTATAPTSFSDAAAATIDAAATFSLSNLL